jgi:hypothetical protein
MSTVASDEVVGITMAMAMAVAPGDDERRATRLTVRVSFRRSSFSTHRWERHIY